MNSIKLALKVLGRRKFFTFISLFGISLTLVVLIVAAAILDNLFAPRKPESRFDRVLCVYRFGMYGPHSSMNTDPGYGFLDRWMRTLPDIERASIFTNPGTVAMFHAGQRVEMTLRRTDGEYWRILDFRFLEGRPFTPAEEAGSAHVAVINDRLRAKLFGNAPALGQTISFEDQSFRVIGVVPAVPSVRLAAWADVWVPISTMKSSAYRHELMGDFHGIVLARDRADFKRLQSEFATRMKHMPIENPREFSEVRSTLDTPFEAFAHGMTNTDRAAAILRGIFVLAAILFMT
ncbi:MAG TPA: ABC transporter permease, partial [Thermoanaerobaculia bacterium]|nr:ABC transporter permease [Thermoanaerobaculia bacterium]